jgi:hypothetical protein
MKQLSLDLPELSLRTDGRGDLERLHDRLASGHVKPEARDDEDRLQTRMDLEQSRGHIHTSYRR